MVQMPGSSVPPAIGTFVAIGDSFTEGLNDPAPGGGFRGWADLVAGALSAQRPGIPTFRYANLAIRGKLVGQVVAEQLPRAVELAPDLVSLAAGGNDILRGTDVDDLAASFEPAVAKLQAAGSRVLIFTGFDPRMFPVIRLLRGRIAAYNMHLRGIADEHGCDLVDLWSMRALKDTRAWSPDLDVAEKTVYNHFASKAELFFDEGDDLLAELVHTVASRPAGEPAAGALRRFLDGLPEWAEHRRPVYPTPRFRQLIAESPALQAYRRQMFAGWEAALERERQTHDEGRILHAAGVLEFARYQLKESLTHGEMQFGAGVVAAKSRGAAEIVDPRQYATGSMKDIYARYRIGPVLPAMGYSNEQLREFEHMINAAPADVVVIATPVDLRKLVRIDKPAFRAFYELEEAEGSATITDALRPVLS